MGIILDTSVLIAAERSEPSALGSLLSSGQPLAISAITVSELLVGLERAKQDHVKARRHRFIEGVLDHIAVAAFGISEARCHARVSAMMSAQGQKIGPHDLLIAATALALDFSILTLNTREFMRVPGLRLLPASF